MKNFFNLVKINLLGMFGGRKRGKRAAKKRGAAVLTYAILVCACILFVGYYYSKMFGEVLAPNDKLYVLIPYMAAISALAAFMFSFFSTGTVLYGYKDYENLSAMPIKSGTVVLSKLFYMYAADVGFAILFLAPTAVNYVNLFGGVFNKEVIVALTASVLFSPMIMLALSVIIGTFTSVIGSFFRKKNVAQTIILSLFIVGIIVLSFLFGFEAGLGGEEAYENGTISKLYFLMPLLIKAMSDLKYSLIFAAINLVSLAAVTVFVCLSYKKLNTVITAKRTNKNFRLGEYKDKSTFSALISREKSLLFSCPTYVINGVMGAVISIVISIAFAAFIKIRANDFPDMLAESFSVMIYAPVIFSFCYLLAPTSGCAISIEGNRFWSIRTMPVPQKAIFNAKIAIALIIYGVSALAFALITGIVLSYSFADILLILYNGLSVAALAACGGLLVNILLPKMNWESENQAVKSSASTFVTMIAAFAFAAAYFFLGNEVVKAEFPIRIYLALTASLTLVIAAICYIVTMKKGEEILLRKIDG